MSKLYNQLQPVVSRLDNKINNVKEQLQDVRQELADIETDWGSSIIDDTLSIQGAAADAKAVGDYHMTNVQAADLLIMSMPIDKNQDDILGDKSSILYNQLKPVVSQLDDRINNINNQIEDLTQNVNNQISSDVTDWLEENIIETGSAIMVDTSLSIQGAAADAKAVGDYIMTDAEAVNFLAEASDDEERDFIGDGILSWLDNHPEAVAVQDGSITDAKLESSLRSAAKNSVLNMAAIDLRNGSGNSLGDCTVFYGDVNGIVDFGTDPNVPDLLSFLTTNSITKIDFVIISHYHADHITSNFATALGTLVNGDIDFSECVFYLPHKGINWSRFTGSDNQSAKETAVKNALTNNNFTYVEPNNGQTVTLTPYSSISFYNIGDYDEYYDCYVDGRGGATNFTIYNNFSMISVLNHCGSIFVLTGDIHELAQSKNYQYIERCDVYKVEHHGANSLADATWMARIIPQFIVVEQALKNAYNTVEKLVSPIRKYCDRGAKLLFTGSGTSTIQSKGGMLFQKTGGCFDLSLNASLGGGIPIYKNSDLNDYTEIGEYYCLLNNTVATLSNCPTTSAFRLVVENPRGADSGSTLYRLQRMNVIVSNTEYRRYVTITDGVATFSDWTPELIELTPYAGGEKYFTGTNVRVIKNGSLCLVRIEGTCVAATSGWETIYYGAPKAGKGQTLPANLLTNSGTLIRARVTSGGSLQVSIPAASVNTMIGTTFMYIS